MAVQKPDFESIKQINVLGDEYWSARDLMPLLGYGSKWQNFEKVIGKAMVAAQKAGVSLLENFTGISKNIPGQPGRPSQDYFLSKRACFLIAQNGDPRKKAIAEAQNYFAFAGEVLDDFTRLRMEQERRLQLRLKVAEGNKHLSDTAMQAGVQPENMPLFHDAGYHGMYLMTENQLAAFWNVPSGVKILDVMGPEALAANLFRINATDEKLVRDHVTTETRAIATHHDVGAIVRESIEKIHQRKPEDLPREENIRKLVEAERRKEKRRLKSTLLDEQEKLF